MTEPPAYAFILPTPEQLASTTDDQIAELLKGHAEGNRPVIDATFWYDELARRRLARVAAHLSELSERQTTLAEQNAKLIAQGAAQNRNMVRLTWVVAIFTAVAAGATLYAAIA